MSLSSLSDLRAVLPAWAARLHPFHPRLLDSLRGYERSRFLADIGAGATVGIVALPDDEEGMPDRVVDLWNAAWGHAKTRMEAMTL